ncbi:hypothetical protein GSI_09274 [Ganoderma sinense ZZ0214-1]|uniref:RNase H type-1 domain-containing protein n=1 Tax=Ganoderma sinense ZZ0214-1 TaxID=1077348 RepID=A0A2G8S649_9APHY|nr:hypothetical protein GSI_09274 [Ganoderma sinense ZZ0214-1]
MAVLFKPPVKKSASDATNPSSSLGLSALGTPPPQKVVFRASLTDQTAIFPAGWGLLYWKPPARGISAAEGEIRYRIIASIASEPRAWSTQKVRAQFAASTDFCTADGKPWSASLFASVLRQLAYSESLVSPQAMADTLSDHFAERYMDKRRVQAMTDPALAFLDRLPTIDHRSVLPRVEQFAIPDDSAVAIRAWEADTAPTRVYSDGALHRDGSMGAGVVLEHITKRGRAVRRKTRRVHLGKIPPFPYNVHDAEIVGLGEALSLAAEEPALTRLSVYTDSRLALNAVRSSAERPGQWRLADLVLHRYDALLKRHPNVEVIFRWSPGHKGIEGNEIADSLAAKASIPPRPRRERRNIG